MEMLVGHQVVLLASQLVQLLDTIVEDMDMERMVLVIILTWGAIQLAVQQVGQLVIVMHMLPQSHM